MKYCVVWKVLDIWRKSLYNGVDSEKNDSYGEDFIVVKDVCEFCYRRLCGSSNNVFDYVDCC